MVQLLKKDDKQIGVDIQLKNWKWYLFKIS